MYTLTLKGFQLVRIMNNGVYIFENNDDFLEFINQLHRTIIEDIVDNKSFKIIINDTISYLELQEIVFRLNAHAKELKNRKKMNNILEGFVLAKGYTFEDIIEFLHDRTSKDENREGEDDEYW